MAHSEAVERVDMEWWPSAQIDTTVPHSARVYDYWLGGKDNFEADRVLAASLMEWVPILPAKVRVNRAFLGRVVRYLVEVEGIRQFLDIGAGLPTARNTHEVAAEAAPGCRVLYVDNDPTVVAHARALMATNGSGQTGFVQADLREPEAILHHPALASTLDLDQPVGVLLLAVLMLIDDAEHPHGVVSKLMAALPAGSCLAISHMTADFDPVGVGGLVATSRAGGTPVVARDRAQMEDFFSGLDLIPPAIVPLTSWRPDEEVPTEDLKAGRYSYGGVGRKPH